MPDKCEIANLLSVEQAISARAATHTLDEFEFLIEADRVHADTGQLCCLTDVNALRYVWRINPGVVSRVKKKSWAWNWSRVNLSERLRQSRRARPILGRRSQRRVLLFLSALVQVASPSRFITVVQSTH